MKKLILSSLIATMLFFGGTANASVAVPVAAVVFVPATAGTGTILVLGFIGAAGMIGGAAAVAEVPSFVREETGSDFWASLAGVGLVLLDEDRQVLEFKSIDPSNASKHGLTKGEAIVYNEDLAIINLTYDEFSKRYNKEMTPGQAIAAYDEIATHAGLSSGARDVLSKVFTHALEKQSK